MSFRKNIFVWSVLLIPLVIGMVMAGAKGHKGESVSEEVSVVEPEISEARFVATNTDFSKKEITLDKEGMKLVGDIYLPDNDSPHPMVIMSHGLGANTTHCEEYAKYFASHGIAAFTFDYIGGGNNIRSDGRTTDMSVLTEADDLNFVTDSIMSMDEVDENALFLMGESQGGFVSAYVACERPDDVAGLILLYPGFNIPDYSRTAKERLTQLPKTTNLLGVIIGRRYIEDAAAIDIYEMMKSYDRKVLILHGLDDDLVPPSYSKRAADTFFDAKYLTIDDIGHGFYGSAFDYAVSEAFDFVVDCINRDKAVD